jgi:hypothetical protein
LTGIHAEGSIVSTLFCLFFWDEMFADIADAFHSPYQTLPLDFHSDSFYQQRSDQIESKLSTIEESSEEVSYNLSHKLLTSRCRLPDVAFNSLKFSCIPLVSRTYIGNFVFGA